MGAQFTEDSKGTVKLTLSPVAIAANTSAEQLFTMSGLKPTDVVVVNKPTAQAGLAIVGFRALTDQVGITFGNYTGSAITPTAAEVYLVHWFRAENNHSTVHA